MSEAAIHRCDTPKSTEKRRHYCCICSNFAGKIVEGKVIRLHRFPANESQKRLWLRRIKLCYGRYTYSKNDRVCSNHFENGEKSSKTSVQCVFDGKKFKSTMVDVDDRVTSPVLEVLAENREQEVDDTDEPGPHYQHVGHTVLETSLGFHDYCEAQEPVKMHHLIDKCEQTAQSVLKDTDTQTDCASLVDVGVQTDFVFVCKQMPSKPKNVTKVDVCIQTSTPDLTIEDISGNDEKVMFYTGIPDSNTFKVLFDEMSEMKITNNKGRNKILRPVDEFLMVLMRLRLGLLLEDLAQRFKISKSACSKIITKWIDYLDVKFNFLIHWPDRETNNLTMPPQFKNKYPNCRLIIDCTELFTETPQSLANRSLMYSSYKSHMTYKALIGINPRGVITFISDLWAGSISDKQITKKCGVLELLEKGDAIMADKGFLIRDLTTPRGIDLIMPPFKTKYKNLSRREVEETRRIANLRIHVERAIERIKNFRILQGNIPITLARQTSKMWKLCAKLANLQPPLVINK